MKKNIHDYERIGRVAGGLLLSSLAFRKPRRLGFLSFMVPVVTGLVGTCPLYSALGISTRPKEDKPLLSSDSKEEQANDYFPVQSSSERAAGHPLVGVS